MNKTCHNLHTPAPTGYIAWQAWAEHKAKTHYQVRCPNCNLFAIWKRIPETLPTHNGLEVQQEPLPKSTNRNQE